MNFVSHQQMLEDVRAWSLELPTDLIAVAGVPRSGILPAAHLALHRNLHLVTIQDLIEGRSPWKKPLRRGVSARGEGRVLVVEDSVNTGGTIGAVSERLKGRSDILYGSLYGNHPSPREVDFVFRQVSHPRCFEWNLFHSNQIEWACLDMDGVLCADWTGQEEEEGPGFDGYQKHLESARPRHLPSYPVLAIVTSRLEKYRPQTIAWLRRHQVQFRELLMSPHPSAAARRQAQDHALRKAEWYRRRPEARLFVESHPEQAREIWERTGRPVLCTDQMRLFGGGDRAEARSDFLKPQMSGVA